MRKQVILNFCLNYELASNRDQATVLRPEKHLRTVLHLLTVINTPGTVVHVY